MASLWCAALGLVSLVCPPHTSHVPDRQPSGASLGAGSRTWEAYVPSVCCTPSTLCGSCAPGPECLRFRMQHNTALRMRIIRRILHANLTPRCAAVHNKRYSDHRSLQVRSFCEHCRKHADASRQADLPGTRRDHTAPPAQSSTRIQWQAASVVGFEHLPRQLLADGTQLTRVRMQAAVRGADVAQRPRRKARKLAAQCAPAGEAGLLAHVHAPRQQGLPTRGRLTHRGLCRGVRHGCCTWSGIPSSVRNARHSGARGTRTGRYRIGPCR